MKVFDLHCDTITVLCDHGEDLVNRSRHISLDKLAGFERWVQCFAVFMPDEYRGEAAKEYFERNFRYYRAQMEKFSGRIGTAERSDQLSGETGLTSVLTIEGGSALAGELGRVKELRDLGAAMMTITWNGDNEIAGGAGGAGQGTGLTEFGRRVIPEMEKQGMIVDLSHISDRSFDEIDEIAQKPFVASHSNARAVCNVKRNLTDRQFSRYVARGGLVGLNYYTKFIREDAPERATLEDLYRHIEHFLALGGEKVLALGSDFDGADMPGELSSAEKIANLYEYMLKSNLNEDLVRDIFYGNACRFFSQHM
ncbi:MAG: membrane dipeptidase [Oscillospiraceae bacterium]|nr:membrane dipeptidase [Oscillospiraceae bacterium]